MATGDDKKLAPHVQEIIRSAQQELQQLNRERAEVAKRICTIKRTLAGTVELFEESILDDELSKLILPKTGNGEPGLTTVCREMLKEGRSLTANETVRFIQKRFPSLLAEHKVPVSSAMTVLNRLVKYGEADSVFVGKRRAWQKAHGQR